MEDFDLIVASFQTQYGIRLAHESAEMTWNEFAVLLGGLDAKTPLGRVVSIRAETDAETIKNMTPQARRIRREWLEKRAANISPQELQNALNGFKTALTQMAK